MEQHHGDSPRRIFLVGPMGAGKTTLGQQLARALNLRFFDSDRVIEERTGASIPLIFELEGEDGFRRREARIIDELTREDGIVLATGGGAVLREENRRALRQRGLVIYLHAPLERLLERTRRDRNRPLLQTDDPAARLRQIIAERDPLYRRTAHLTVETGGHPKATLNHLLQRLRQHPAHPRKETGKAPPDC